MPLIFMFVLIRWLISSRTGTVLLILLIGGYGMLELMLDPRRLAASIVFDFLIVFFLIKRFRNLTKRR
jgi:hypothetical protein